MNHHTKDMIRGLRKQLAAAQAEIRSLRERIGELQCAADNAERNAMDAEQHVEEAEARAVMRIRRAEREAREIQERAESREWDLRRATEDLRRARESDDAWGVERALEKLKRL